MLIANLKWLHVATPEGTWTVSHHTTSGHSSSLQTVKTFGLSPKRGGFWPDFADFKHDHHQATNITHISAFPSHHLCLGLTDAQIGNDNFGYNLFSSLWLTDAICWQRFRSNLTVLQLIFYIMSLKTILLKNTVTFPGANELAIYFVYNHIIGLELLYYQTSNISNTISPNLNVSYLALHLSSPNPLKPGIKSVMKMCLSALLQLHEFSP